MTTTKKLPKNLVLRGDTYYVRKKVDGKVQRISTECTDLKSAERRATEILKELNDGKFGWDRKERKPAPTLETYATLYLKLYSVQKKKNSAEADRVALIRWRQLFGERKLDTFVRSDFAAYMTWRQGAPRPGEDERREEDGPAGSVNTMLHELAVLHTVFEHAIADGILTTNPMKKLKKPEGETRNRVLTRDEQGLLMTALYPEYQRLVTVFLGTGLRANELLKLEATDVKLDDGYIDLPKTKAKGGKKGRLIPILPEVDVALRAQIAAREKGDITAVQRPGGTRRKNDTAMFNMGRESALAMVRDASQSVGVADFTLHDLRRTFGTRAAEGGCPIKHLSMVMGHSDISITAKYYVHIGDDNLKKTMLALDLGLKAVKPSKTVVNFQRRATTKADAAKPLATPSQSGHTVTTSKRRARGV